MLQRPLSSCASIDGHATAGVLVSRLVVTKEDVANAQGVFLTLPLQAPHKVVYLADGFLK